MQAAASDYVKLNKTEKKVTCIALLGIVMASVIAGAGAIPIDLIFIVALASRLLTKYPVSPDNVASISRDIESSTYENHVTSFAQDISTETTDDFGDDGEEDSL